MNKLAPIGRLFRAAALAAFGMQQQFSFGATSCREERRRGRPTGPLALEDILADRAFAAAGFERKIACEVNDVSTLRDLVANGLGIAPVPRTVTRYPVAIRYMRPRS